MIMIGLVIPSIIVAILGSLVVMIPSMRKKYQSVDKDSSDKDPSPHSDLINNVSFGEIIDNDPVAYEAFLEISRLLKFDEDKELSKTMTDYYLKDLERLNKVLESLEGSGSTDSAEDFKSVFGLEDENNGL